MPKTPSEDVNFLLLIIEQLSGHIDWTQVANKADICTSGAANKRFVRLKKRHEDKPTTATSTIKEEAAVVFSPKKNASRIAKSKLGNGRNHRKVKKQQMTPESEGVDEHEHEHDHEDDKSWKEESEGEVKME